MADSSAQIYRLLNRSRDTEVAGRVERTTSPLQRAIGLLGRERLEPGSGLWLDPCGGVHTLFMRFPIDVLFLDPAGRVAKAVPNVPPWRFVPAPRGTRSVVELTAGALAAASVQVGDRLALELVP